LGVEPSRIQASWVSASEGAKFAEVVSEITKELTEIGPNKLFEVDGQVYGTKAEE
jgi:coenzyme F420-reducing hydrogenase delta subunit